jgi:hypothetical protein
MISEEWTERRLFPVSQEETHSGKVVGDLLGDWRESRQGKWRNHSHLIFDSRPYVDSGFGMLVADKFNEAGYPPITGMNADERARLEQMPEKEFPKTATPKVREGEAPRERHLAGTRLTVSAEP